MPITVSGGGTSISVGVTFTIGERVKGPRGPATILAIDPVTHCVFIRYADSSSSIRNACPHVEFIEKVN